MNRSWSAMAPETANKQTLIERNMSREKLRRRTVEQGVSGKIAAGKYGYVRGHTSVCASFPAHPVYRR